VAQSVGDQAIVQTVSQLLNVSVSTAQSIVDDFAATFSGPLMNQLGSIRIRDILKRKNPYMYAASGIQSCADLVRRALNDFVSSSTETLFGNFLERMALTISGGHKSATQGVDIERRRENLAELYVVKSGPAAFNSASRRDAERSLDIAERRLRQGNVQVQKYIGFAYGRKRTTVLRGVTVLSSKDFWARLSGRGDFHQRLLDACAALSGLFLQPAIVATGQRLLQEAHSNNLCVNGNINWNRVLQLVSG
jgi:hypothetical protein